MARIKTIYICGDSFATPDPESGAMWAELLQARLGPGYSVINTSSVSASNTLVAVQVDSAIKNQADFIIMLATASTRREVSTAPVKDRSLLERFQAQELISYSIYRPYRSNLSKLDQQNIRDFETRYSDLQLSIFRDFHILLAVLYRLTESGIPFLFDQGGFEHPSFDGAGEYFKEFDSARSQINLWDYGNTVDERPYYHIKDPARHEIIADYYYTEIINRLNDKT